MKNSGIPPTLYRQVLIVEDEARLRDMLVDNLVEMDLDPIGVASAESAVKILGRRAFDIALVDLNLPGAGGLSLCEMIHERWPNTQMIILTGFGDLDAARRAFRLNVVDFLKKPCGMDELEVSITRARSRCMEQLGGLPKIEHAVPVQPVSAPTPGEGMPLDEIERTHILAVLARHGGNREATATELGISVRKLYYRLQQWQHRGQLPEDLPSRSRR